MSRDPKETAYYEPTRGGATYEVCKSEATVVTMLAYDRHRFETGREGSLRIQRVPIIAVNFFQRG